MDKFVGVYEKTCNVVGDAGCGQSDERRNVIPRIYGRKPSRTGNFALINLRYCAVFVQNVKLEKNRRKRLTNRAICGIIYKSPRESDDRQEKKF